MFITFEGIEGCGKTTQLNRLARRLQQRGIPLVITFEPGGTEIGKKIRHILLDAGNRNLSPLAELLLYEADRAQHVTEVIGPGLRQGKWVLCDRHSDATTVYQGIARGQDLELVRMLNRTVSGDIAPDKTFLLDCPVETGLSRALVRNRKLPEQGQDRFEREDIRFHEAVRQGYLELAGLEPDRFVIIDAAGPPGEIETVIYEHLKVFLDK